MSYCRVMCDGSTVYAYEFAGGGYESWGSLGHTFDDTLADFLKTMQRYRDTEGEHVPDYVFQRISEEMNDSR